MAKIKVADVQQVLRTSAQLIRDLQSENSQLREKVASVALDDKARTILASVEEQGLDLSHVYGDASDMQEKVAALREHHNLDVLAEAVNLSGGQSLGFAKLGGADVDSGDLAEAEFINEITG